MRLAIRVEGIGQRLGGARTAQLSASVEAAAREASRRARAARAMGEATQALQDPPGHHAQSPAR